MFYVSIVTAQHNHTIDVNNNLCVSHYSHQMKTLANTKNTIVISKFVFKMHLFITYLN